MLWVMQSEDFGTAIRTPIRSLGIYTPWPILYNKPDMCKMEGLHLNNGFIV